MNTRGRLETTKKYTREPTPRVGHERTDPACWTNLKIAANLPIAEDDICIIFGNALDNAIEACEKVKSNPYIKVLLSCCADSLVCKIENSCDNTDCINRTTSKEDINNHGIGRINMELALSRYDSVFNINQDKDKYTLSIVFMGLDKA